MSSSQECHSYQSSRNFVAKLLALGHSKFWSPGSKKLEKHHHHHQQNPSKSAPQCDSSVFFQFFLGWLQTTRHWARQLHPLPTPWIVALNLASNSPSRERAWNLTCTVANFGNLGDTGSKSEVKRKSSETHDSFWASWISRIFVPNRMLVIYPTISNPYPTPTCYVLP